MTASLAEIKAATAGDRRTGPPKRFVRMFKPRFAALVKNGTKRQTVRPVPARMPRVGDILDLRRWKGRPYNSPQVKLIETTVLDVKIVYITKEGIFLQLPEGSLLALAGTKIAFLAGTNADDFARRDGFADWKEMREWFETEHSLPFEGIVIYWP